jgi:hypothetical protein
MSSCLSLVGMGCCYSAHTLTVKEPLTNKMSRTEQIGILTQLGKVVQQMAYVVVDCNSEYGHTFEKLATVCLPNCGHDGNYIQLAIVYSLPF